MALTTVRVLLADGCGHIDHEAESWYIDDHGWVTLSGPQSAFVASYPRERVLGVSFVEPKAEKCPAMDVADAAMYAARRADESFKQFARFRTTVDRQHDLVGTVLLVIALIATAALTVGIIALVSA